MCTALHFLSGKNIGFFGRTMDFAFDFDPHMFSVPVGCVWKNFLTGKETTERYGFLGIGTLVEGSPAFFDGVNQRGLAGAALYLPGVAVFPEPGREPGKEEVAAGELIHCMLGRCASLEEVRDTIPAISIVGMKDSLTGSVAPLHWMFADRSGNSLVVEYTADGLALYDNPVGVMTNSPDFKWHLTNLRNYGQLTAGQDDAAAWHTLPLPPPGQGFGSAGLPGSYAPADRFVRTAFQRMHTTRPGSAADTLNACFHIMEGVTIPKGVVKTSQGADDYTQYTAFINLDTCTYYIKSYDNFQPVEVAFDAVPAGTDLTGAANGTDGTGTADRTERAAHDLGSIHVPARYGTLG